MATRVSGRAERRASHPALLLAPISVLAIVVVVVTLVVTLRARDQPHLAAGRGGPPTGTLAPQLTVDSVVVTGAGATSRVELTFDGPLPDLGVDFVESFDAVDAVDEIVYTVQPASAVKVCGSVHSFPPPADGTVDVFVPADWFARVAEPNIGPVQHVGRPAKFVPCGPYDGFYQYSIWGPASADRSAVTVTIENSGRSLVVSIAP